MEKRDIDAMMFAIELIKEFETKDPSPKHHARCVMAIESLTNVMNREVERLPLYNPQWNRINVGPYTVFQPVDGSFYLCHVDGEGGAFSASVLLNVVHKMFTDNF